MKNLLILGLLSLTAFAACQTGPTVEKMPPAPEEDGEVIEENDDDTLIPEEEITEEVVEELYLQNEIVMTNVSDLKDAQGEGVYGFTDGQTKLYANFMIEDPAEDYFYEGWLVCNSKPYSTGELTKFEGLYENIFYSTDVPEDCEKYVLTIEPNDNDPAPADHVMDGEFKAITDTEMQVQWDDERFEVMMEPIVTPCEDDSSPECK